jgi:hypothetical protein
MMKKSQARIVAATAEPMVGSPTTACGGIDISALYIDMLCDKFKNRGIKKGLENRKSGADLARDAEKYGISMEEVSVKDDKYRTMKIDGKSYMSSSDFAAYYKDLRGYRLPSFYSRAEKEYEEAEAGACVQESGKPPKKAVWLAIKRRTKKLVSELFSSFIKEEVKRQSDEMIEGKKKKLPRGVIATVSAITVSLLLIVCSSVMVSRASMSLSSLENEIDYLESVRDDLATDLEIKNNMLGIKEIATKEYGMISGDYAASRYLDMTEEERIDIHGEEKKQESLITQILRAIGLIGD